MRGVKGMVTLARVRVGVIIGSDSLRAFGDEEAFDCVLDEHWTFRLQNVMIRVSLRIGNEKNLKILIFVFLYVLHRQHIVEHAKALR